MDGEADDKKDEGTEEQAQAGEALQGSVEPKVDTSEFERQIAERDQRIAELEASIAEAARSADAENHLKEEIAELKQQAADERLDFQLQLAGCRNVAAGRAVLEAYDGDVDAMKAGEGWLFSTTEAPKGATGLPNAGAATDEGKDVKRWRELAGL